MAPFIAALEDSPSGLWRTLGKRVGFTPSRVRISYPPPAESWTVVQDSFCTHNIDIAILCTVDPLAFPFVWS